MYALNCSRNGARIEKLKIVYENEDKNRADKISV
jgi:hypothetical protein